MSGPTLYVVLVAFGVVVGVTSGLLGVGGGTLVVPFLTLAVGLSQHAAEATSLLVILPTAIAGSLALRRRGVGDLGLALRFGVIGAVGSVLGALLALALSGSTLRVVFAVFVGLVGLRIAYDGLRRENVHP
ncbi:MAG TPA: sulfite exporter TauE/SafE family protein [Gaiellaceae bacterium]|nr:sulfite exporter TauE/SafE family protein [Gaiellaceae bacterium]